MSILIKSVSGGEILVSGDSRETGYSPFSANIPVPSYFVYISLGDLRIGAAIDP
jgi:hypothetical protein